MLLIISYKSKCLCCNTGHKAHSPGKNLFQNQLHTSSCSLWLLGYTAVYMCLLIQPSIVPEQKNVYIYSQTFLVDTQVECCTYKNTGIVQLYTFDSIK